MILYKKQNGGTLTSKGLPEAPTLNVGKFNPIKNVKAMAFHRIPDAQVDSIKRKAKRNDSTFADTYRDTYKATDALYGTNVGDYYAGNTRQEVDTGIIEQPSTPAISTNGEITTPATSRFLDTNNNNVLSNEEVDNELFRRFYKNQAAEPNVTDHYRNLYRRLGGAKRLY